MQRLLYAGSGSSSIIICDCAARRVNTKFTRGVTHDVHLRRSVCVQF